MRLKRPPNKWPTHFTKDDRSRKQQTLALFDALPKDEHYVSARSERPRDWLQWIIRGEFEPMFLKFLSEIFRLLRPPKHSPHFKDEAYPDASWICDGCHGLKGNCHEVPVLLGGLFCEGCFLQLNELDQLGFLTRWVQCQLHKYNAAEIYAGSCTTLSALSRVVSVSPSDLLEAYPRLKRIVKLGGDLEEIDF